jgi:hypothetical protein
VKDGEVIIGSPSSQGWTVFPVSSRSNRLVLPLCQGSAVLSLSAVELPWSSPSLASVSRVGSHLSPLFHYRRTFAPFNFSLWSCSFVHQDPMSPSSPLNSG